MERWHVVAMDQHNRALYSATVGSEPGVAGSAAAAIMVACDRLAANGYDPRIVVTWHVSRKCPQSAEVS